MALKFCPICGFKLYEEANFCSNCGEALSKYNEANEANQPAELPTSIEVEEIAEEEPLPSVEQAVEKDEMPLPEDINDDFVQNNDDFQQELNQPQEIEDDILIESEGELLNENGESDEVECFEDDEEDLSELNSESQSNTLVESEVVIDYDPIISDSTDLGLEKEKDNDIQQPNQDQEENKIKILGIPEWAFYSALIIIGICIVVFMKIQAADDSSTEGADTTAVVVVQNDTIKNKEGVLAEKSAPKQNAEKVTTEVKPQSKTPLPKQSGTDTDSAYHVVITTLADSAKAAEVAKTCAYKGAYLIKNGKKQSVAVYRSLKKEEAKLYMDSIIKKDIPDAWLYHGVVK